MLIRFCFNSKISCNYDVSLGYMLTSVKILYQSDARALRVVLSLTGVKEGLKGHVVVEMSDLDNEPLVKLVGGDLIETVVAHDVIGRLMIQCALQPGLAQVSYKFFLNFADIIMYDIMFKNVCTISSQLSNHGHNLMLS